MMGTSSAMARFTAVPMAPDELSTRSSAGETFSRNTTAPSAARMGSLRATFLISETASFTRWMAGSDFQPKACRRNRALNCHSCCAPLVAMAVSTVSTSCPCGRCHGGRSGRSSGPSAARLLAGEDTVPGFSGGDLFLSRMLQMDVGQFEFRPGGVFLVRRDGDRSSEAGPLELRHPPVGIGAQLGGEGLHGLERALDRGAVRDGLRGQEADPRQLDVAGAEPPAASPLDGLARFGEESAGSGAVASGSPRVRERRQDARLVPERGAPRAREPERPLERARGGGDVAGRELGGAEKRSGLDPGERTAALL